MRTAVWRRPADGPRLARRLNVDGDGQGDLANHGGEQRAVFVYQIEAYRYWQHQLRRDGFVLMARGPQAMTVAGIDALLYLPGHPAQQVRRALTIPALSEGWKASFRELASQPDGGQGAGNAGLAAASSTSIRLP